MSCLNLLILPCLHRDLRRLLPGGPVPLSHLQLPDHPFDPHRLSTSHRHRLNLCRVQDQIWYRRIVTPLFLPPHPCLRHRLLVVYHHLQAGRNRKPPKDIFAVDMWTFSSKRIIPRVFYKLHHRLRLSDLSFCRLCSLLICSFIIHS